MMEQIRIVPMRKEHAPQLGDMQKLIFPTLTEPELISADKYRHHVDLFPKGQFVAVVERDGKDFCVGVTSTFRINVSPEDLGQHTFEDIVSENWFRKHDPNGEWLYGADMSVHPDFRRMGIARLLYDTRRELVKRLNLRGEYAGGMLPGYDRHRHEVTIEDYVRKVAKGEMTDPTLSAQVANGFEARGVLYGYITDPRSDNNATLIVRLNPDYKPTR